MIQDALESLRKAQFRPAVTEVDETAKREDRGPLWIQAVGGRAAACADAGPARFAAALRWVVVRQSLYRQDASSRPTA